MRTLEARTRAAIINILISLLFIFLIIQACNSPPKLSGQNRPIDGAPRRLIVNYINNPLCVVYSNQNKLIASGDSDQLVRLWNSETARCVRILAGHSGPVKSVAFSPDGKYLASGGLDGSIILRKYPDFQRIKVLRGHDDKVTAVLFDPKGKFIISSSSDATVRLWSLESGSCLRNLNDHPCEVTSVAVSPKGNIIASGCFDGSIRLWDMATSRLLWRNSPDNYFDSNPIGSIQFSPQGDSLGVSDSVRIRIMELNYGKLLTELSTRESWTSAFAFCSDGRSIISGGYDGFLRVWDCTKRKIVMKWECSTGEINAIATGHGGGSFVTADTERGLQLWELSKKRISQRQLSVPTISPVGVFPYPDNSAISIINSDYSIAVLNFLSGKRTQVRAGEPFRRVFTASISPDLRIAVLIVCEGGQVSAEIYNAISWKKLHEFSTNDRLCSACISSDSKLLLLGGEGCMLLYDLEACRLIERQEIADFYISGRPIRLRLDPSIRAVAINPAGGIFAGGGFDDAITLWRRQSRTKPVKLVGHSGFINSIAFSPDGRFIVSGGHDKTIRKWEISTGKCLQTIKGHTGEITQVSFLSSDEIISASSDSAIKIWNFATDMCSQFESDIISPGSTNAFWHNGGLLTSAGTDSVVRLWNRKDYRLIFSLVTFSDGNWVIYNPEGDVDIADRNGSHVSWTIGMNDYPLGIVPVNNVIKDLLKGVPYLPYLTE
jgi:WD40 repeat protein